jgi:hypothetical protein
MDWIERVNKARWGKIHYVDLPRLREFEEVLHPIPPEQHFPMTRTSGHRDYRATSQQYNQH